MIREQAELKILSLLEEIRDVAREYNPDDKYLSLTITKDSVSFNNKYWEHPDSGCINFWTNNNIDRSKYFKEVK